MKFMLNRQHCYTAAAKSLQSCPTLCDPIDGSPPGSSVPRILQTRTLEWLAISFSNAWKWKVKVKSLSRVWLFATPWTAAYQAPPSMWFSRQEYWSEVPSPSPEPKYSCPQILILRFCIQGFNWWVDRKYLGKLKMPKDLKSQLEFAAHWSLFNGIYIVFITIYIMLVLN